MTKEELVKIIEEEVEKLLKEDLAAWFGKGKKGDAVGS